MHNHSTMYCYSFAANHFIIYSELYYFSLRFFYKNTSFFFFLFFFCSFFPSVYCSITELTDLIQYDPWQKANHNQKLPSSKTIVLFWNFFSVYLLFFSSVVLVRRSELTIMIVNAFCIQWCNYCRRSSF